MKCPYCFEGISDAAIVCPTCQRDLVFFKPISERVGRTEQNISQLTFAVKELREWSGDAAQEFITAAHIAPIVAIAFSGLLATMFHWLSWQGFAASPTDKYLLFLSATSPFIAGFGLGIWGRKAHLSVYALLGALAGTLGGAQYLLLFALEIAQLALQGQIKDKVILYPHNAGEMLFFYLLSGVFLFAAGGQIGLVARHKEDSRRKLADLPDGKPERPEPLRSTSSAIAPYLPTILTVAGSIICALIAQRGQQIKDLHSPPAQSAITSGGPSSSSPKRP